ncbi:host cell division inhibitor Icd-like protein [Rahnella aceris]|uniref:host cell division inhibitor Icd-like protein n=1 Tax=Rahnella sp. (strain Y9602) TaxID=2703885 RepID=UPI001C27B1E4|nr:host cell division inhibitor Icd-like protein [Rahnella aceris]MBU9848723.1 host cell division inhibitor Icd-like protein [Rahnella aceris]
MADIQSTQTHPKFTWRFLALSVTESSIVRITAATEREARDQSPAGCVMVFAARLPLQGVSHA